MPKLSRFDVEITELDLEVTSLIVLVLCRLGRVQPDPAIGIIVIRCEDPRHLANWPPRFTLDHTHPQGAGQFAIDTFALHLDGDRGSGQRPEAPVGPTVACHGAHMWQAIVDLDAGLDPFPSGFLVRAAGW